MIKHYCDRCRKEIKSQVYYITITSDSLTSLNGYDNRQTFESASCNIVARLSIPRIYCKECCDEIEKFMNKSR